MLIKKGAVMSDKNWGFITPVEVSEIISFQRIESGDREAWRYSVQNAEKSMLDIQAEGTARIWNILDQYHLALLADEVGMGKTMQALSVCALLWRIDPDARILVIAPNHSVAENWINEYKTFINSHIRHSDNLVRTGMGNHAVHEPLLCGNLDMLEEIIRAGWCHFIIAKTSSLSVYSGSTGDDWGIRVMRAYENGVELNRRIIETQKKRFDILIIDEAQYYRRFEGDSLRVSTGKGLFGAQNPFTNMKVDHEDPLAKKVLLLTATPNHTSNRDIQNITRYFDAEMAALDSQTILSKIGLRRFRRLGGKIKYQYRQENDIECDFDDVRGELFFGLYLRKRAVELARTSQEKRTFTYGYLEGFESTAFEKLKLGIDEKKLEKIEQTEETETENGGSDGTNIYDDFNISDDSALLNKLARDFRKLFPSEYPVHPKYSKVSERITNFPGGYWNSERNDVDDKNLIFVRRIPSVRELAARLNNIYDKIFMEKIYEAWGKKQGPTTLTADKLREEYIGFTTNIAKDEIEEDEIEDDEAGEEDELTSPDVLESLSLNSVVFDLFRTKKEFRKDLQRTHASNFRTRFTRETDPFSLLFQPALDYKTGSYTSFYQERKAGKVQTLYIPSVMHSRLKDNRGDPDRETIFQRIGSEKPVSATLKPDTELETLWSIFFPLLEPELQKTLDSAMDIYQKEGFARYLQKGILFASSGLIELYCWFIEAQKTGARGEELYNRFIDIVRSGIEESLLFNIIKKAISQYIIYTEKICGFFDKTQLVEERWNIFNRQNPSYACSGDTQNRQRLINAFNSPFFPNVLVATSVLQEGVNLQYNCRNVFHYGIAWTPGDNEQRVGRIDRMFSLVERNLNKGIPGSTLNIYYPYMNNTFDKDQVGEFIMKKYISEVTLDRCQIPDFDKSISPDASYNPYWKDFLRKPVEDYHAEDPYPPKDVDNSQNHQSLYKELARNYRTAEDIELRILEKIDHVLKDRFKKGSKILKTSELRTQIALIEVILHHGRHQPVIAELNFSSELSGLIDGTVYYLTFRTPITSDDSNDNQLKVISSFERHRRDYKLVQLCHDPEKKSHFTFYMRTDLPFFVTDAVDETNLSEREIAYMFEQLVYFADQIEFDLYGEEQDLKMLDMKDEKYATEPFKNGIKSGGSLRLSNTNFILKDKWIYTKKIRREFRNMNPMILTHLFQFVKFRKTDKYLFLELPYPHADLDPEEEELLGKWFDYVCSRVEKKT